MITKNIPRDLRERVREFYHLRYAKGRIFDEGQILDSLNAELRTEIASYNTRAVVSVVPLLANSPLRFTRAMTCLLYTSPSPRDKRQSRMPSSA